MSTSVGNWSKGLNNGVSIIIRSYIDHMRFVAYMDVSFITYFLNLLVLFCMVYMVVCFVCFCYTGCPNKSARFNFVKKRIIYSKSVDIFISV